MLTNASCTIYRRKYNPSTKQDEWERQHISAVWWHHDTKSSITTDGLKSADVLTVRIWNVSVQVKKGDYLVKGDCSVQMQTVKDLKNHEYFCVTGTNYNTFGDNPHIKVVAV